MSLKVFHTELLQTSIKVLYNIQMTISFHKYYRKFKMFKMSKQIHSSLYRNRIQ